MKIKKKIQKTKPHNKMNVPDNWLLLLPLGITVVDIKAALEKDYPDIEIWPEAGILEIILGEKLSMDIERAEDDFNDESVMKYIREKALPSVFYLTLKAEGYEQGLLLMKQLVHTFGGVILGDTENLMPVIEADKS